jgi:Argininosuccinate lyase
LQPYLYKGIGKTIRVFSIMNAVIRTMKVEEETLKNRSYKHAITITDFADALTKNYDIPFRHAHHAASAIANMLLEQKKELHELHLKDVNMYLQEKFNITLLEKEWKEIISPEAFIQKRNVYGGPSKKEMERMINNRKESFRQEEEVFEKEKQRILQAENNLNTLASNIIES